MTDKPLVPPDGDRQRHREPVAFGEAMVGLKARLEARGVAVGEVDWDAVEAETRAQQEQEHTENRRLWWRQLVPEDMADAHLHRLDSNVAGTLTEWIDRPRRGNVVLVGPVGVGKSFAAFAVGAELVDRGERVYAVTTPGLLRSMRPEGDRSVEHKARATDHLILDDLGVEALTEWAVASITDVLDERVRERRPTIVTTNAPYRILAERLGERIMSRLTGGAVIIAIDGEDRRRQTW